MARRTLLLFAVAVVATVAAAFVPSSTAVPANRLLPTVGRHRKRAAFYLSPNSDEGGNAGRSEDISAKTMGEQLSLESPPAATVRSCSCGATRLAVRGGSLGRPLQVVHCHCRGCRRSTGAAFSTWGCVPLASTHFVGWDSLRVWRRGSGGNDNGASPRADRFFCSGCGCSVSMTYPASGRWPEPNTLWLSAAFLGDGQLGSEDGAPAPTPPDAFHMYPEERPQWCAIEEDGCDGTSLTYMGGDHTCVIRDADLYGPAALSLAGRAGEPRQDPAGDRDAGEGGEDATSAGTGTRVPPGEAFRLRGTGPIPAELPGSTAVAVDPPEWLDVKRSDGTLPSADAPVAFGSNLDWHPRTVKISGVGAITVFEVWRSELEQFVSGDADGKDGGFCDADSPRPDLCGGVVWPGARLAAEYLLSSGMVDLGGKDGAGGGNGKMRTVMEIGAGTGLISLAAAKYGGSVGGRVDILATDASVATLELIEAAAAAQDLGVRTAVVDFVGKGSEEKDGSGTVGKSVAEILGASGGGGYGHVVVVAADLLYSPQLARAAVKWLAAIWNEGGEVIVTDSQIRCCGDFLDELGKHMIRDGDYDGGELAFVRDTQEVTGYSYEEGGDMTFPMNLGLLHLLPRVLE